MIDGGKKRNAAFTQYREEDALRDQGENPQDDGSNPKVLVSNTQVQGQQFFFSACKSNKGTNDSFMGYPAHKKTASGKDVYYGHVSAESSPHHCLTRRSVLGDTTYISNEKCTYSDDSGQLLQFFKLTVDGQKSTLKYLGNTSKKGGLPDDDKDAEWDFYPGDLKAPAAGLHNGSPEFTNYTLQLV